jgi:hypothetical protein
VILLAVRQKLHAVPVYQSDILQVQSDATTDVFLKEKLLQLGHVLRLHPANQGKNNSVIR